MEPNGSSAENSSLLSINGTNVGAVSAPKVKPEDTLLFILNNIVIPTIAVLGMLGNALNMVVLWLRYRRRDIDIMEKGALLGLIALAVSDMCFCTVIFPHSFFPRKIWFTSWGLHLNYQLYSLYFHNVFIKTSTWLTLVVGFARYVGICHPLRARLCIGLCGIRVAVLTTFLFWFIAEAPLIWTYSVKDINIANTTYYYLDVGDFATNKAMEDCFTYLWAILGYFLPVIILIFCNGNLIHALKQSQRMRREAAVRNDSNYRDTSTRITLTLILLILMFMILVSPSEIIHFLTHTVHKDSIGAYKIGMVCTNVMQAINFAFSFVLYCTVNATFRRTIAGWCYAIRRSTRRPTQALEIDTGHGKGRSSSSSSTHQTQRTLYYSALKQSTAGMSQNSLIPSRCSNANWKETCNI